MRDIYISEIEKGTFVFSTRIDFLLRFINTEIDYKEFGSRWILFNQISPKSIFKNVERIARGTEVRIDRKTYNLSRIEHDWQPNKNKTEIDLPRFSELLQNLCLIPFNQGRQVSLSLSGGMDSRVLLSFLLRNADNNWSTHTLGDTNHPDSIIVKKIVSGLNIRHEGFDYLLHDSHVLESIKNYSVQSVVNNPASSCFQNFNYSKLSNIDAVIIDGGFGEIWRREFFNKILVKNRHALLQKDASGIIPSLRSHRAEIFSEDVNRIMIEGSKAQLESIFNSLPEIGEIGVENFLDLMAIKIKLLNNFCHEQARADNLVINYMPFIQPVLLENLFSFNLRLRKNGRALRQILNDNYKPLEKFPLVKGLITRPYKLKTMQVRAWELGYRKLGLKLYHDDKPSKLINLLKTFILDTFASNGLRESNVYNMERLNELSSSLKNNRLNNHDISELDWWLAFELFRQEV